VHHTQALLHTMPKPVIAAVNGAASGLGADTALACDFIIASEWATSPGRTSTAGSSRRRRLYFLPRRVGLPKAKELIFTGRKVDVDEAVKLGHRRPQDVGDTLLADAQAWAAETRQGARPRRWR
jgi:enoyl-CoA hydratase/carnithine racemase